MTVIEVDGKVYPSKQAFADAVGLSIDTVEIRRSHGWSWEKIANTPVRGKFKIEYDGKIYDDMHVFSDAFNLSYATVWARRKASWSWEEIALTPVGSKRVSSSASLRPSTEIDFRGKHCSSLTAFADDYDIPRGTVYAKLAKGQSLEEIVTASENRIYEYNGVKYKSVASLARAVGMSRVTLRERLKNCDSVEEAISKPYLGGCSFGL